MRAAVIGVGYLGKFHAEKYASLDGVELVAVADQDEDRARTVAATAGCRAVADYRSLYGEIDCASIAVPTSLHFEIARNLLSNGIDVLVEKPITDRVSHAEELVALAAAKGRILQVGHLERFNPAIRAVASVIDRPRFIECHRLAPFTERGTDVDVILDLMIHDLDVILSIVNSEPESIEAVGVPVLSASTDIANARLRFANGCIANLTASRVTLKQERKMRLFQADTYVAIDYGKKHVQIARRVLEDGRPSIAVEERDLGGDALFAEIEHFVEAVRTRRPPIVDGAAGLRALAAAERIRACLQSG